MNPESPVNAPPRIAEGIPALPLDYRSPVRRDVSPVSRVVRRRLLGAARQLLFASGLSVFAYGLGESIHQPHTKSGEQFMAVGALVVGLTIPFRRGDRI